MSAKIETAMRVIDFLRAKEAGTDHMPALPLSRREEAVKDAALGALLQYLTGEQDFADPVGAEQVQGPVPCLVPQRSY